ncbi:MULTISPECIES: hypothetical protein [Clostridioides]|uniref:hypothetical protein n=1 Tax=unclassified Clostridioides TaxID=2635829 RepID=UPI00038D4B7D|nr:hypothetical protein QEW_0642 [Clostridioides difficile CD160]MCC0642428.1 hypothetical protein [Clostridioides sp. ES-S-0049-03]MCC0678463.1 hypothetical protein [Clostridioides sp. ES-W-0018-02]MCC0682570.1 hypothetical protein [Clostridioides sp. ES-S-0005-03]MCC0707294.1 hypothetical protein [Clostridioides sp. ES-S-0190-01]MCC0713375.1 hypothetical protein [Clostridioides sp. ES-W-0017-02]MDI0267795.1 hypothetical protein [Clostridioides difficile]
MNKIQVDKLMQDEVRAIIPIVDENGKEEYIEVRNPDKKTKEEILNKIWAGMENPDLALSQEDILKMLVDELTNIELNIEIENLINGNISSELETVMYHIGQIENELTASLLMNTEVKLGQLKNEMLQDRVLKETEEIEKMNNIKDKVVN